MCNLTLCSWEQMVIYGTACKENKTITGVGGGCQINRPTLTFHIPVTHGPGPPKGRTGRMPPLITPRPLMFGL